jgi:hypothetical protein
MPPMVVVDRLMGSRWKKESASTYLSFLRNGSARARRHSGVAFRNTRVVDMNSWWVSLSKPEVDFIADLFRELLFWSCPFKSRWNACFGDCMHIYPHNLNLCWTRYIVAGHVSFQVRHAYSLQPPTLECNTGEGEAIMKSSMLSKAFWSSGVHLGWTYLFIQDCRQSTTICCHCHLYFHAIRTLSFCNGFAIPPRRMAQLLS